MFRKTTFLGLLVIQGMMICLSGLGWTGEMAREESYVNEPIRMEHWPPYYYPHEAVVWSGVPIQWVNATASPHTVQHDACGTGNPCMFDSGKVNAGESFTLPGLPPGRYPYHCQLHPIMGGTLIVEDPETRKNHTE